MTKILQNNQRPANQFNISDLPTPVLQQESQINQPPAIPRQASEHNFPCSDTIHNNFSEFRSLDRRSYPTAFQPCQRSGSRSSMIVDQRDALGTRHFERMQKIDSQSIERKNLNRSRNDFNDQVGLLNNSPNYLNKAAIRENMEIHKFEQRNKNISDSMHFENQNFSDSRCNNSSYLRPPMNSMVVRRSPSEGELSSESSSLQAPDLPFQLIPRSTVS